jgi:hypothetical protein
LLWIFFEEQCFKPSSVVVPAPKKKKIDAGPIYFTSFTTKLVTIERFFSSGFSRDFRTEISCFVPVLRKITKKATKNRHHEQSPPTRISLPVANFQINPQSSWV